MKILVTGGTGYIGSHTTIELIAAGHSVVIVDKLSNSSSVVIDRLAAITKQHIAFYNFDLLDKAKLNDLFVSEKFDAVMHFAGYKAVGESTDKPLEYYRNNLDMAITILEVMRDNKVHKLVFSSSATVYGTAPVPYREDGPVGHGITNPYGQTKYMTEQILQDVSTANPKNQFAMLRYFNPIGAHPSGLIGESPQGIPNNIMPYITQVAAGKRKELTIFGNDYPTPDGTCQRDYIDITDLARGHLAALEHLTPGISTYNLGSGRPVSVLELINVFTKVSGIRIPYTFGPRRSGDLPAFYAEASKAKDELGWQAETTIEQSCQNTWRWQTQNPNGYDS